MNERKTSDERQNVIEWRQLSPSAVSAPIVRQLPYLELKLEHPTLEPGGLGDRFFPDAVPYELDGTQRVFYWRTSLAASTGDPNDWELACASTHELVGIDSFPAGVPPFVTRGTNGTNLVVDGTIAGETRTTLVSSYSLPNVSIDDCSDSRVELTIDGTRCSMLAGERREIRLEEQRVNLVNEECEPRTVTPELSIRFPGQRELHHPAHGATYQLFPSFDFDIEEIPHPLPIPTATGELDDTALAEELGVDLSQRPYPERVLWQAFAHTAFGLRTDTKTGLTQLDSGDIVLQTGDGQVD